MMLMQWFLCVFSSGFLYKSICYGYSFELHGQVDAIQMGMRNICLYKVDKKTMELLDIALIGVCGIGQILFLCPFLVLKKGTPQPLYNTFAGIQSKTYVS